MFSGPFHSLATMNSVVPFGPPRATEKAGRSSSIRWRILAALRQPGRAALCGAPQRTIGVEADAVGAALDLGPHPPIGEAVVVLDVEGGHPRGERFGDEQGGAVGRDGHAVGEGDGVGDDPSAAVRRDHGDQPTLRAQLEVHTVGAHHVEVDAIDVGGTDGCTATSFQPYSERCDRSAWVTRLPVGLEPFDSVDDRSPAACRRSSSRSRTGTTSSG